MFKTRTMFLPLHLLLLLSGDIETNPGPSTEKIALKIFDDNYGIITSAFEASPVTIATDLFVHHLISREVRMRVMNQSTSQNKAILLVDGMRPIIEVDDTNESFKKFCEILSKHPFLRVVYRKIMKEAIDAGIIDDTSSDKSDTSKNEPKSRLSQASSKEVSQPHTDVMPRRRIRNPATTDERSHQLKVDFAAMVALVAKNISNRNVDPQELVVFIQMLLDEDKEIVAAVPSLFQSLQNARTTMEVFKYLTSSPHWWNFQNYGIFRDIITKYDDEAKTCMKLLKQYEWQHFIFKTETTLQEIVDHFRFERLEEHANFIYMEVQLDSPGSQLSMREVDDRINPLVEGFKYGSFSGAKDNCISLSFHLLPSESKLVRERLGNADTIHSLCDNNIVKVSLDHVTVFTSNKYECQLVPALSAMQIQKILTQSQQPSISTGDMTNLQIVARAGSGPRIARMIVKNYRIRRGRLQMYVQEKILCIAIVSTEMKARQRRKRNEDKMYAHSSSLRRCVGHYRSISRSEYRH